MEYMPATPSPSKKAMIRSKLGPPCSGMRGGPTMTKRLKNEEIIADSGNEDEEQEIAFGGKK